MAHRSKRARDITIHRPTQGDCSQAIAAFYPARVLFTDAMTANRWWVKLAARWLARVDGVSGMIQLAMLGLTGLSTATAKTSPRTSRVPRCE